MAPRMPTIAAAVAKALDQIRDDKCGMAGKTLETLSGKMGDGHKKPGKPNKFAKFVAANYARIAKAHPGKAAPDIMKHIAKEWRSKHA